MMHQCSICRRIVPIAPGSDHRAFVVILVAHTCLGGTTRFHKWYEPDEQEKNLERLLDSLELVCDSTCMVCGNPIGSGTHPFCYPMDAGS
jgi:hypothetical protein